jgi:hypothetical protein
MIIFLSLMHLRFWERHHLLFYKDCLCYCAYCLGSSKTMFVFRNSLFEKPLSKLFCIYLPLGKLVNGKHFPVNEKYFPVNGNTFRSTENTFQLKKNLVWFSGKCFLFWLCMFSGKWFPGNYFPNFPVFVCH